MGGFSSVSAFCANLFIAPLDFKMSSLVLSLQAYVTALQCFRMATKRYSPDQGAHQVSLISRNLDERGHCRGICDVGDGEGLLIS